MGNTAASTSFLTVAISGPLRRTFTYLMQKDCPDLQPGQRVLVPFGRSRKIGYYLGSGKKPPGITIKPVIRAIDHGSFFPDDLFKLCTWMADYYFANPADCLAAALPPAIKSGADPVLSWCNVGLEHLPKKTRNLYRPNKRLTREDLSEIKTSRLSISALIESGIIREDWPEPMSRARQLAGYRAVQLEQWEEYFQKAKISPRPFDGIRSRAELLDDGWTAHYIGRAVRDKILEAVPFEETVDLYDIVTPRANLDTITMTGQQQGVFNSLLPQISSPSFGVNLLHGVTGSGKTLVYCRLAREVIRTGRTVLVLTPEIALTGTTLAYFRGLFGERVTVIHSAMTERERLASFTGIREGKFDIVIGPRSAIFAPLKNIGLIVVDEEHDPSYKQDDPSPRFHGRDCAIKRGQINDIPVVLGSASPSVESYYHTTTLKYRLLELTERPAGARLPTVRIVDMKTSRLGGDLPFISWPLKKDVDKRLAANEQVILFLNRRGYSPQMKCARCGKVPTCPNCRVKLTWHKVGRKLSCHYCGWMDRAYDVCSECESVDFIYLGAGTQRVEDAIPRLFDGAVPLRLDSDAVTGKKRLHDILTEFAAGRANLLLGTQMVTKGLDLPGVTFVGVLSADLMLDLPDFRASERTFAQLLQVAGRSGRAEKPGEVMIQTYYPENDVIGHAAAQDYQSFYRSEIGNRKALGYPPFGRLINFTLSGKSEDKVEKEALTFRDELSRRLAEVDPDVAILGPAPCPMYYLRGSYRRHLFIKTKRTQRIVRTLAQWEEDLPRFSVQSAVKIVVDVDPDDMM